MPFSSRPWTSASPRPDGIPTSWMPWWSTWVRACSPGVRVGIATAQGLATMLGVPIMGASSLDALALRATTGHRYIWAVVDVRRGEGGGCRLPAGSRRRRAGRTPRVGRLPAVPGHPRVRCPRNPGGWAIGRLSLLRYCGDCEESGPACPATRRRTPWPRWWSRRRGGGSSAIPGRCDPSTCGSRT